MNNRVLFLSHTSALEPLLQAQGIPHIRELSKRGFEFTLLTFERKGWTDLDRQRAYQLTQVLGRSEIDWQHLHYGQLPILPNSIVDIVKGAIQVARLVKRKDIRLIHCRSYVPAYIALLVRQFVPIKFVFDMRGLMLEEYVSSGHWSINGWEYKNAKRIEAACLRQADSIVVMSDGLNQHVMSLADKYSIPKAQTDEKLAYVPNCTDLDRFRPDPQTRIMMRERFGLSKQVVLLWLVGNIMKWHMPEEVVRFYLALKNIQPNAFFLVISKTPDAGNLLRSLGLSDDEYKVINANPEDVSSYIVMGDIGISFMEPGGYFAPVKVSEYLSCGLPVVVNTGQAGIDLLIKNSRTGTVVTGYTDAEYNSAAQETINLLDDSKTLSSQCRQLAQDSFSLEKAVNEYERIYKRLLA